MQLGTSDRLCMDVGRMVINSDRPTPLAAAMTLTVVIVVTADVERLNVADVVPSGTVTLAGNVTRLASLVASVTTVPPIGAGLFISTVPIEVCPPASLLGSKLRFVGTALGVTRT